MSAVVSNAADAALKIAKRGKPIFPCNRDKKPLTKHGFKDATTDPQQIRRWWSRHSEANPAMPTGAASEVIVIDIDQDSGKGKDGESTLAALIEQHGPLPPTLTARTPRGGRHLYFQHPRERVPNSESKLGLDVDVRGDGGYVLLPPSQTAAGDYIWEVRTEPAPLPDWLLELVVKREARELITQDHSPSESTDLPRAQRALKFIDPEPQGDWLKVGMALHGEFGEGGWTIFDEWSQGTPNYDAAKNRKRWDSFTAQSGIGIGSLFHLAREGGYVEPSPTLGQRDHSLRSAGAHNPGEKAEIAEDNPLPAVDWQAISASSAISSGVYGNQKAVFRQGGFLERYLEFAGRIYESPDAFLLGAILPGIAAALGRKTAVQWQEGELPPNIFSVLIGPPSAGKSDAFKLPDLLARDVIGPQHLLSHRMSRESLFDNFLVEPNRLLMLDDANELFTLWKSPGYGESFGNAFLRLFDGQPLTQDFRSDQESDGTTVTTTGPTCTSIGLGITFNFARLDGLPQRSGLERRLFRYVAEGLERFIPIPRPPDSNELNALKSQFARLLEFSTRFELTESIRDVWTHYQRRNREVLAACGNDEGRAGRVRTAPTYALKFAMLFEAEQWLERGGPPPTEFAEDTLATAFAHVDEMLRMTDALDQRADRNRFNEQAERLIERVRVQHNQWNWRAQNGSIYASRSEITSRFAHDGRRGSQLSTDDLYLRVIPKLVERNEAKLVTKRGRYELYAFRAEPADSLESPPVVRELPEVCQPIPRAAQDLPLPNTEDVEYV